MKKLLLSLLVVLGAYTSSHAQASLVATLSHEGETTAFYGAEAFKNALTAAADEGDVITLSSGTFAAADISKSVTIRGAGMSANQYGALPTVISGSLSMGSDNNTIEGIFFDNTVRVSGYTNNNNFFIKCRFKSFEHSGGGNAYNQHFLHCRIAESLYLPQAASAIFSNCIINQLSGYGKYNVNNCIVLFVNVSNNRNPNQISNSSISNSIICSNGTIGLSFASTVLLTSNVGNKEEFWTNSLQESNVTVDDLSAVIKDFAEVYTDDQAYKLTSTGAAYLGSDGTQVGIYGGNMAYDPTPTNPQITKAKVASHSSADGKLSIELEVNGANH